MERLLRLSRYLLLCLCCLSYSAYAEEMQVFELQGATLQEILPLIKPFVGPDGTVTGMHNRLIVRTSPERMVEVRKILAEFDRAPRRLLIHLRDSAPSQSESGQLDLSVKTPRVQIGDSQKNSLSVKRYSTRTETVGQRTLQTLEGQPTLISSGILRPEVTRSGFIIGPGGGYETSIDYQPITSGFYAKVQLVGDRVRIEIASQRQSPIDGSMTIEHQEAETVVTGRLGEWLPLVTIAESRRTQSSGIASRRHSESAQQDYLWVKVETLPD
jgi:hypothetical protein